MGMHAGMRVAVAWVSLGFAFRYFSQPVFVSWASECHLTLPLALAPDHHKHPDYSAAIRTCMVPFAKALVPEVDNKGRKIVVDPPEGLMDLTASHKMRRTLSPAQQAQYLKDLAAGKVVGLDPVGGAGAKGEADDGLAGNMVLEEEEEGRPGAGAGKGQGGAKAQAAGSKPGAKAAGAGVAAAKPKAGTAAAQASRPAQPQQQQQVGEDVEDEEEWDEEEEEEEGQGSSKVGQASERWKLRRKLGTSMAGVQRRVGAARRGGRRSSGSSGEDSE